MNEFLLILRVIIGFIFLSSALHKIMNYRGHKAIVKNYKILPNDLISLFVFLEVISEFTFSIFFLIGLFTNYAAIGLAILLIAYSIAILMNIVRGNNEISCGCGGVIGEHKITYKLIVRNLLILLGVIVVYSSGTTIASIDGLFINNASLEEILNKKSIFVLLISVTIIIFYDVANKLIKIRKLMEEFFGFIEKRSE
ncbi:MauE/DoxX family redox-associated membrane protein [Fictibacillus halophilus]|uniref:MauE/DoxX family redox-associated membrane protein n=1 Tax=Fictibacillus halophilus TaxID=1610490 RepID=UPI001CFA1E88|nr:MauE/DoxX family redox-associated membrane protein [Fictibacillus halophilus]